MLESTAVRRRASSPAPRAPWARTAIALLAGLGLLLGAVVPHGSVHEHRESLLGAEVDRGARHPGEPMHFEASAVEVEPGCTACLLQIQTGSTLPRPEAGLPFLAVEGTVAMVAWRPGLHPVARFGPARAPPLSP